MDDEMADCFNYFVKQCSPLMIPIDILLIYCFTDFF